MTSTDAKGNTVRRVDLEARKFYESLIITAATRGVIVPTPSK